MKAEERRHLKENELAERLGRVWQTVSSGSTTNTIIWGIILVALALAIGWRYYSGAAFRMRSAEWSAVAKRARRRNWNRSLRSIPGPWSPESRLYI